jgi:LysR family hydrogen peroxide-inducible transcriptional activator
MEMHQLRYFLAVCETLNFTRASEKCNISQPALTKGIQRLEEDLGGLLFDRTKNTVALSEFGCLMQPSLKNLYETACKTKIQAQQIASEKIRRLRVGVMCTIGMRRLVGFLAAFERRHPDFLAHYEDGTLMDLHDKLDKGEIDLAISSTPYEMPKRFSGSPLFEESFHIAFPPGHRFENLAQIPMSEMNGEPYVSRMNCEYSDLLIEMMDKQGVTVSVKHETPREDWIQEMVMAGMGLAYMPESIPFHAELLRLPVCKPEVIRTINILTVTEREATHEMHEFMTAAVNYNWTKEPLSQIA